MWDLRALRSPLMRAKKPRSQAVHEMRGFLSLDVAHREKLRPREPAEEVGLLVGQLDRASALFSDFLSVAEFAPSRKREHWSL